MIDTNQLLQTILRPEAATGPAPTITLLTDPVGGTWTRVLILVDPDTVNKLAEMHQAGEVELVVEALPDEDFRAQEMAWLSGHLAEVAQQYTGEWLAIDGPELVAHGPDLAAVYAQASAAGHPDPFVTAMPAGGPPELVIA
jgi:Family of unknown function (DUF5678)